MNSFAIWRGNAEAQREKLDLEVGLLRPARTDEERAFVAAIRASENDRTPRLIFSDWLTEQNRDEESALVRSEKINGTDSDIILDGGPRHGQKVPLFGPGCWSVVRRATEGASGGHQQHIVYWERITIQVVRVTKQYVVLADGRRMALHTLTGCVRLESGT